MYTTYEEWLESFNAKSGGYSQIVKGMLNNIDNGGVLKRMPVYFEIKKEK